MRGFNPIDASEWMDEARKWTRTGVHVHQEFVCPHCRFRQTVAMANTFYAEVTCFKCCGLVRLDVASLVPDPKRRNCPGADAPLRYVYDSSGVE